MSLLQMSYHEAAHALIARSLGRPVEVVSILAEGGGVTATAGPIAGDRSPEALEQALVIVFAGDVGSAYAPRSGNPDIAAAAGANGGGVVPTEGDAYGPTDAEIIERYRADLGDEAIERARALAVELVDRMAVLGVLERVADRLYLSGLLTADDLERLVAQA